MMAKQVFAEMMKRSRDRSLSERERLALARARQQLRRQKRPAMNAQRNMDYEATDKDMSSWVVTSKKLTTRFFLTDEGLATDIPARAKRFRWIDLAEQAAKEANHDPAWRGFKWKPMSVAQMIATRKNPRRRLTKNEPRETYPGSNAVVRIGRQEELRYMRDIGRAPGPYSHKSGRNSRGKLYTVPPGWYYVSKKAIIIAEERPRRG